MPKKKRKKQKVYLIIHDGKRVLVGRGGKTWSGVRKGNHFPGGTIDRKDGAGPKGVVAAALRELKEEMGITDVNVTESSNSFVTTTSGMEHVSFIDVRVQDVNVYVGDVHAHTDNQNDTPFSECDSIELDDVKKEPEMFFSEDGTDWFGKGIEYAINVKNICDK